jgi:hypothetical protein
MHHASHPSAVQISSTAQPNSVPLAPLGLLTFSLAERESPSPAILRKADTGYVGRYDAGAMNERDGPTNRRAERADLTWCRIH